jgi:hypothetical protein
MGSGVENLATTAWILLLVPGFLIYVLIFVVYCISRPLELPPAEIAYPDDAYKPSITKKDVEISETARVNEEIDFKYNRTRFGETAEFEFIYHEPFRKTLYSTIIEKEVIKIVRIYSAAGKQVQLAYEKEDDYFRSQPTREKQQIDVWTAPLQLLTHVTSSSQGYPPTFFQYWWNVLWEWIYWFEQYVIYFIFSFGILALILAFYIPGTFDTSTTAGDRAVQSSNLTAAMGAFVVFALISHTLFIWRNYVCSKTTPTIWYVNLTAYFFLLLAFGVSIYLFNISRINEPNPNDDDSTSNISASTYAAKFTCTCPVNENARPTMAPTSFNNSAYSFQCSNAQLVAADYQTCDLNCGVCGENFYGPFVTFTILNTIYCLFVFFLVLWQYINFVLVDQQQAILNYIPNAYMAVTVHGSVAFGYPLTTRVSRNDAIALVKYIGDYIHRQKDERTGDFLRHMAMANSKSDEKSVSGMFSNGVEGIFQTFQFVARIVGVPI